MIISGVPCSRRELLKSAATLAACGIVGTNSAPAWGQQSSLQKEWWSIKRVSKALNQGDTTSAEITDFILDRIDTVDSKLHSYLTVMREEAKAMAASADKRIQQGQSRGLLDGVPIAVKDLFYTKDVKTTNATKVMSNFIPAFDATVVHKLKTAGAVLLGKLNQTEGAMVGYNPKLPYPRNPWDINVWPGVSSSGSGVAAAAGLAYATLGTDTGGSIRYPAAACGVVGLKPTWGPCQSIRTNSQNLVEGRLFADSWCV